jgi:GTPase SAR1 family protein
MTSSFYRGAHGIVVVYDVTRMETFTNIPKWLKELELQDYNCVVKILIGNKSDLSKERAVPREMAFKYADNNNIFLHETSAKTGDSVREAFEHLVSRMLVVYHEDTATTTNHGDLSTFILSGDEKLKVQKLVAVSGCAC